MYNRIRQIGLAGIILNLATQSSLWAVGTANIGNEVPSARAAGQGYVGVAGQNEDPTAAWSNPAAITNLKGTQATYGLHWENLHASYESDAGVETKADVVNAVVPNFSMTHLMNDGKLGFGFTVQSPYGLETHWGGTSPLRYVATDSILNMATISPVMAFQVTPTVSIGGGPDYVRLMKGQLDRKISVDAMNAGFLTPTANGPDGSSSLKADGNGWGGHVGLMVQPNDKHAVGVTYHSAVTIHAEGRVKLSGLYGTSAAVFGGPEYVTAGSANIELPENVQLGYAFKPTNKLTWETNAAWYHWSAVGDFRVNYEETDPNRLAALNTGNPAQFQYRDAWSFSTGVNYKHNDRWQLRGGLWYEPYVMPESNFNPAFMDLSRYGVSTGLGYAITKNISIDAAYSAAFFGKRTIHNNVGQSTSGIPDTGIPALGVSSADIDGTYKNFANLVALNVTCRFGL